MLLQVFVMVALWQSRAHGSRPPEDIIVAAIQDRLQGEQDLTRLMYPQSERAACAAVVSRAPRTEDSWGTPYLIECIAAAPLVVSAGPDGLFGTADDLAVRDSAWPTGRSRSSSHRR